ncbi:hypothetical protein MKL09_13925 [Methylobacterium sp. J-048]|uniref:hypothetical protein n=1 Tax=Methylobacterium sp. J-048 TaxID=2836635 RepID=UPI001FB96DB3|nr:hypothetical protein [Methylobacterium sp. J-048]MCJ2057651.1 hypothetical protein [Methylobacterium sp. J-048]
MKEPNTIPAATYAAGSAAAPADLDPLSSTSSLALTSRPSSSGTNAARDVFLWLKQVAQDPDLPPLGYRLAIIISQCVDRRKGYAHPSHSQLQEALGASRRGIQKTVAALELRDHLGVTVGRGAGHANRYKLKLAPGRSR